MKNLKSLSLVAMLFAVVAAFAFKPAPKFSNTFGLVSTDGVYFYVGDNLAGKTAGVDYICVEDLSTACKVVTDATPDSENRIPVGQATIQEDDKRYIDLIP